ncbi:hypothetical protein VP01_4872g1 [Puccinia sorghi]|uniref:Retrovirus-related Pol polyprotein from transposon TNT 1-94-like beta-barrel domain-containing protein n=1 Tax=Puccinia sorghi TaxID=27349 RepID=A0A0L6UM89_9BASI|nr:hypothetical protein VP01_4872g1 [Puccinia sorghi]
MSNPKHLLPNLSKTSFTTWKQKILGHSQQLGLKKSLTSYTPPADSVAQETYEANRSKTAGIHLSYMGTVNYKHFLLKNHYEAKTSGNHTKVYNDFITFQFKGSDLAAYLDTVSPSAQPRLRKKTSLTTPIRKQFRTTTVEIADGNTLAVEGDGFVNILTEAGTVIKLKAIHVPQISTTLISLGQLLERGCKIKQTSRLSFDIVHEDALFFRAPIRSGTCMVRIITTCQGQSSHPTTMKVFSATDVTLLHRRTLRK